MKLTRKFLVGALLVVAPLSAAHAERGRTVDAGGGLYAQQSFDRALIREPSGAASELMLPFGGSLYRLVRLADGWVAAGDVDSEAASDIFVLRSVDGQRRPFPAPPNPEQQPLRSNPVPLVQDGQLLGLAWIAGEDILTAGVWASLWSGTDWAPPEMVSPVDSGTQIGLAGAVLTDGSWLLVWSRYDGNDDEIVWSQRRAGSWTAPAVLHAPNDLPNIVPSLIATGRGALAAWSSSEGTTYRVKLAAFEDGGWGPPVFVGPPGSVHPTLTAGDAGARMLYRTVRPATWTVVELDDRGNALRRAVLPQETTFRPGLSESDSAAAFEWPGFDVATPLKLEAAWQSPR